MRFQIFKFTIHGNTHRTRRPFHYGFRRMAIGTMQAHKLFEAAVKDLFRTAQIIPFPGSLDRGERVRFQTRIYLQTLRLRAPLR